jgi:hypothetical protein
LNLQSLYRFVVQDIAKRNRFWWRRVETSFSIVPPAQEYDYTAVTTSPTLTEIVFDEITDFRYIVTPNPLQTAKIQPAFGPGAISEMLNNPTPGPPSRYTMLPGDYKTILIDPPDTTYTAYLTGWAMPNPASDSAVTAVPLIPPWGHNTIVAGIMAKIFRFAYGSQNAKTIDAVAEYEQGIQDLAMRKQFDPHYDVQLSLSESAVRST